jgi:hypothetical protein
LRFFVIPQKIEQSASTNNHNKKFSFRSLLLEQDYTVTSLYNHNRKTHRPRLRRAEPGFQYAYIYWKKAITLREEVQVGRYVRTSLDRIGILTYYILKSTTIDLIDLLKWAANFSGRFFLAITFGDVTIFSLLFLYRSHIHNPSKQMLLPSR